MTIPLKSDGSFWHRAYFVPHAGQVKKNEQVITQVEFVPIEELKAKREQMETWSQLCLDNLDALLNAKHI
jgi:hypothetical protein